MISGPPRGMRDFYPEDVRLRNWLFSLWREVSESFGFEEYDGPLVESEELFTRKSGEEIVGQLYNFEDKGGRRLALRPEMTPTLARMIIAKGTSLPRPIKWFSIPQCFRYERMSRGRRREHYQWNLDIVGVKEPSAEAEVIAAAVEFLKRAGLGKDDFKVFLSNRRLLATLLRSKGLPDEKFAEVCVVIDKKGKVAEPALKEMMENLGLSAAMVDGVFEVLRVDSLEEAEGLLVGTNTSLEALEETKRVLEYLSYYGLAGFCRFDISIVRGLLYYTGPVFELFDVDRKFRAICGGGRYDNLLESYGGGKVTAVGLGFGDVVISEILAEKRLLPDFQKKIDFVVIPFSQQERKVAMELSQSLRTKGNNVSITLDTRKLGKALAGADRAGAEKVAIVAPDELAEGKVVLRDMRTGEEKAVPIGEVG
ncbi:histidine--tRNA ligase [bacterium]|nr:histidine--tRNA ligase [bacterium]